MNLEGFRQRVSDNKWKAATAGVILVFSVGFIFQTFNLSTLMDDSPTTQEYAAPPADIVEDDLAGTEAADDTFEQDTLEVEEADIEIESQDADETSSQVLEKAENFNGSVEETRETSTHTRKTVELTLRVPSEDFDAFTEEIRQEFETEHFHVRNYIVDVERERSGMDVLTQTAEEYDAIRQEVEQVEDTSERIELLMLLTEKEMELQEMMNRYEDRISSQQERAEMSTVEVRIEEEKDPSIMPEDVSQQAREEVSSMADSLVNISIGSITGGVRVLFRGFQALIYIAFLAIPVYVGYRIAKPVYSRLKQD